MSFSWVDVLGENLLCYSTRKNDKDLLCYRKYISFVFFLRDVSLGVKNRPLSVYKYLKFKNPVCIAKKANRVKHVF